MITMLKDWKGPVEVNGNSYTDITAAISNFKPGQGGICIKLCPKQSTGVNKADRQPISEINDVQEYRITVKKYMTEPASPEFDFMAKWNNDNPMPLRTMTGHILKETRGMVQMELHGVGQAEVHCMRCGRSLSNPISRHYGIGPECMNKIGFGGIAIDDIDTIKEKLQELTWTGWIIKSAITEQEEV